MSSRLSEEAFAAQQMKMDEEDHLLKLDQAATNANKVHNEIVQQYFAHSVYIWEADICMRWFKKKKNVLLKNLYREKKSNVMIIFSPSD